jgi:hypothetical protein
MTTEEGSLTLPDGIELYTKTWKVCADLGRDALHLHSHPSELGIQ